MPWKGPKVQLTADVPLRSRVIGPIIMLGKELPVTYWNGVCVSFSMNWTDGTVEEQSYSYRHTFASELSVPGSNPWAALLCCLLSGVAQPDSSPLSLWTQ